MSLDSLEIVRTAGLNGGLIPDFLVEALRSESEEVQTVVDIGDVTSVRLMSVYVSELTRFIGHHDFKDWDINTYVAVLFTREGLEGYIVGTDESFPELLRWDVGNDGSDTDFFKPTNEDLRRTELGYQLGFAVIHASKYGIPVSPKDVPIKLNEFAVYHTGKKGAVIPSSEVKQKSSMWDDDEPTAEMLVKEAEMHDLGVSTFLAKYRNQLPEGLDYRALVDDLANPYAVRGFQKSLFGVEIKKPGAAEIEKEPLAMDFYLQKLVGAALHESLVAEMR